MFNAFDAPDHGFAGLGEDERTRDDGVHVNRGFRFIVNAQYD
jgi:hypothetical protein